jgi:tetratricopeptide (TPR) repeat protein
MILKIKSIFSGSIAAVKLQELNLLRITFIAGIILAVSAGGFLTFLFFTGKNNSNTTRQEDSFIRLLQDYDIYVMYLPATESDYKYLNSELDRIEKRAIGVEAWLSVIKRRRALAAVHPPSMNEYHNTIERALKIYPLSQPITAIAAAALIKDKALNNQAEEKLRNWLPLFTDPAFNTIRLGLHILLGDFKNPETAAKIPYRLFSDGSEDITVNLAILKILNNDFRGAAADILTLTNTSPSPEAIRFSAEYYYDFGDLRQSAEIFSWLEGDTALLRQADALYLAGYTGSARSLWVLLAENPAEEMLPTIRSLYNLAVTAEDSNEALFWLDRLVKKTETEEISPSRQAGVIRFSRLHNHNQALDILQRENTSYPLIDLEIVKRSAWRQESGRQIAEAWLLLDRHPDNKDLYWWAAWKLFFMKYYDETEILLNRIEQINLAVQWLEVYQAVQFMYEGNLDKAEGKLLSILPETPAETVEWYVYAKLGRVHEARRSPTRALENYELAALKIPPPKTASRIEFRIARCFTALGSFTEARRSLEYALELDPENITASLELDRLNLLFPDNY